MLERRRAIKQMAKGQNRESGTPYAFQQRPGINLASLDTFRSHPWVEAIIQTYETHDRFLAEHACISVLKDLNDINGRYAEEYGRVAFADIQGRVKDESSVLRKMYKICQEMGPRSGITQSTVQSVYCHLKDICGIRLSCPYFDEIEPVIANLVRPDLARKGYLVCLDEPGYADRNLLDNGDKFGYRSYHFYIKAPAIIDIFGNSELVLVEIQVRSELQHVWADKSHDLLYKPDEGWVFADEHVLEDMRQLSNSLRAADQQLMSIRDRILRGEKNG